MLYDDTPCTGSVKRDYYYCCTWHQRYFGKPQHSAPSRSSFFRHHGEVETCPWFYDMTLASYHTQSNSILPNSVVGLVRSCMGPTNAVGLIRIIHVHSSSVVHIPPYTYE